MTRVQFLALSPRDRGYVTYMMGSRNDEPHVPDEKNPYPAGSLQAVQWDEGQYRAVLDAQDSEE
jgi:hypothetical protein